MLDYVERLTELQTVEDLWQFHCAWMAEYGFDRLLYGFTKYRSREVLLGNAGDYTVLSNHAPAYARKYIDGGLFRHAPMFQWALRNAGARSWRCTTEGARELSPEAREVLDFDAAHGVNAGYTISFCAPGVPCQGVIALAAQRDMTQDQVDEIWAAHGRAILAKNYIAHLKLTCLPQPAARPLTPRQREALEWVGRGKTAQDIAQIMGLTPATVEKHLRLARTVLDADTTTQAVLRAAFQNQIYAPLE